MWLIDTKTYRLHSFGDHNTPEYAIISHRWRDQEVSFANLRDCQMVEDGLFSTSREEEEIFPTLSKLRQYRTGRLKSLKGWEKVEHFCKKSRAYGLEWAWIDTACIDKSSSAELQEAINSMFRWYQIAVKCFVYMDDVTTEQETNPELCKQQFRSSVWFTRAWTLQELLAPGFGTAIFLNRNWEHIGLDTDLLDDISLVTKIPRLILSERRVEIRQNLILDCSIAQRMSWAAERQVTRKEDVAYALLGLFDVNMPMLYGEGDLKAFERLQSEIIRESTDETILAWNFKEYDRPYSGLAVLAVSPRDFFKSDEYRVSRHDLRVSQNSRGRPIQVSQRGLIVEAILVDRESKTYVPPTLFDSNEWQTRFALPLLCSDRSDDSQRGRDVRSTVFLPLQHWKESEYVRNGDTFTADVNWAELAKYKKPKQFCIRPGTFLLRKL